MSAAPFRTLVMPDDWYTGRDQDHALDVGIRFAVRVLHAAHIPTAQSCEGGAGHAYPEPTIDLPADEGVGLRAVEALEAYGLHVRELSRVWTIRDGMPRDVLWRVVLRAACPERADDRPNFVTGVQAV